MGCMESNHYESLFLNYVKLLLGLILPKRSWTKQIDFGQKYYGVMKEKFFDIIRNRRFGTRKVRHSTNIKEHSANIKTWRWLDDLLGLF